MKLIAAAKMIWNNLPLAYDEDVEESELARGFGILIFEIPFISSGKVSTSLLDKHGFRFSTYCAEHFHSRQRSGRAIIAAYKRGRLTFEKLCEMLREFAMVHYVTSEENIRLAQIQKNHPDLSWEEQYALGGIVLVDDRGPAPVWYWRNYIIDGAEYTNIRDASEATSLGFDVIRNRCNSNARKWNNYKVVKETK